MALVDPHEVHDIHKGIRTGDDVVITYDTYPSPLVRKGKCEGWRCWYGEDWLCLVKYDAMRTFVAKVREQNVMNAKAYAHMHDIFPHIVHVRDLRAAARRSRGA